jgi:hypothetical protein
MSASMEARLRMEKRVAMAACKDVDRMSKAVGFRGAKALRSEESLGETPRQPQRWPWSPLSDRQFGIA